MKIGGMGSSLKRMFSSYSEEDLNAMADDEFNNRENRYGQDQGLDSNFESDVEDNTERSIKNKIRLEVIDERTAWIMRLLIMVLGVLVTISLRDFFVA